MYPYTIGQWRRNVSRHHFVVSWGVWLRKHVEVMQYDLLFMIVLVSFYLTHLRSSSAPIHRGASGRCLSVQRSLCFKTLAFCPNYLIRYFDGQYWIRIFNKLVEFGEKGVWDTINWNFHLELVPRFLNGGKVKFVLVGSVKSSKPGLFCKFTRIN